MQLAFTKMNGLGNDFIVIEDLDGTLEIGPEAVSWFTDRHFGVGGDGLIVVRRSTRPDADYYMHYFNADGSLAEMCGNGARCFAKYVLDHGLVPPGTDSLVIDTLGGPRPVVVTRCPDGTMDTATIDMGTPELIPALVPFVFEGDRAIDVPVHTPVGELRVTAVSMGNPHAIVWVDDVDTAPVDVVGPYLETHERFPNRTNVEFAEVVSAEHVRVRVWERGVGETLACGTGACAVVVAGAVGGRTGREVTVELPGGDLSIRWAADDHVHMTGSAAVSFTGHVDIGEEE